MMRLVGSSMLTTEIVCVGELCRYIDYIENIRVENLQEILAEVYRKESVQ